MGLFDHIFDFNHDGKVSFEEELVGLNIISSIDADIADDRKLKEAGYGDNYGDDEYGDSFGDY